MNPYETFKKDGEGYEEEIIEDGYEEEFPEDESVESEESEE